MVSFNKSITVFVRLQFNFLNSVALAINSGLVTIKDDSVLISRKEITLKDQEGGYNKTTHILKKALTHNTQYIECYESKDTEGKPRGKGGKGGSGEARGLSGEIYIWRPNGDDGSSGFGGKDSKDGNSFKGRHLNKVVFSDIKRVKEKSIEDIELLAARDEV